MLTSTLLRVDETQRDSTAADLDDVKPDIKPKIRKSQLEDQGVIDLTGD